MHIKVETKHTNKQLLAEGLKTMLLTLALLILGPIIIHIAFTNQEKPLYIPLLVLGIIICALAIYFGFKGINIIMDSLFKNESTKKD